jgi:Holliday junction resolvasome RuvABC endonuclease subunit
MNAGEKLREIRDDLESLLQKYPNIERAGIEKLYFGSNITTGISVAECR